MNSFISRTTLTTSIFLIALPLLFPYSQQAATTNQTVSTTNSTAKANLTTPTPQSPPPISSTLLSDQQADPNICTLTGKESEVAFPTLKQCYIFTRDSCCTSLHDEAMQSALTALVSSSCVENSDEMIQYMCFGCYNLQGQFVNNTNPKNKTIRVCKDFASRLYTGGNLDIPALDRPSEAFDMCGLVIDGDIKIQSIDLTSQAFFRDIKPPFFEDYTILLVDGDDCYNKSISRYGMFLILVVLAIISAFIF